MSAPQHKFDTRGSLQQITRVSWVIVALIAALSLAGLLLPEQLYTSEELRASARPNDLVNLVVGVPILLGTMALARRDSWLGWLGWPGALLYSAYNYTAYVFSRSADLFTLAFVVVVVLCGYGVYYLWQHINKKASRALLANHAPNQLAGWVLIAYSVVFSGKALSVLYTAFQAESPIATADVGVAVADVLLTILLLVGGVALLRHDAFGYVSGLGLQFGTVALFVGVILVVAIQPLFTVMAFPLVDVLVLLGMAVVSFVAFGLYVRAVRHQAAV